jgi:hypothetical protein
MFVWYWLDNNNQNSSAIEMPAPDNIGVVEQQTNSFIGRPSNQGTSRSSRTTMIDEQHE